MSLRIAKAGILDTIQDAGRFGHAHWGINTNGAMDQFAMAVGNSLVANTSEAVIEMHFPAPEIIFEENVLISLTGADFVPEIDGHAIPLWKSLQVPKDSKLAFKRKKAGMRCYLSIHGGINIQKWLGSFSTNVKARIGGLNGRALQQGDVFTLSPGKLSARIRNDFAVMPWTANIRGIYDHETILVTKGNEYSWLNKESQELLFSMPLTVSSSSDRMASFLQHTNLNLENKTELLSSPVSFGTIQCLPSGQLCVLMADHQTTGGYPRVGHVISAHLPAFAQKSPSEKFSFQPINNHEAEKMLFSLQSGVKTLFDSLQRKLRQIYGVN